MLDELREGIRASTVKKRRKYWNYSEVACVVGGDGW